MNNEILTKRDLLFARMLRFVDEVSLNCIEDEHEAGCIMDEALEIEILMKDEDNP